MSERANIALACIVPGERTSIAEWLTQSGYDAIAIPDLARLEDDLQASAVEALIADMALVPHEDEVAGLMRRLGSNRPLVVLGDTGRLPRALRSDLRAVARPLSRDALLLSVGLALGEGRPVRRLPRRHIEPIVATAHGVAVTVREASARGVGLELVGQRSSVLPPFFRLKVPAFGVHVMVKRAWLVPVTPGVMRCGGTVEYDMPGATQSWTEFAREAPAPVSIVARRWVAQ